MFKFHQAQELTLTLQVSLVVVLEVVAQTILFLYGLFAFFFSEKTTYQNLFVNVCIRFEIATGHSLALLSLKGYAKGKL